MAITLNSVKCPECCASLPIEEGRTQVFCSYCGAKVIITNDNEHIYRHIDEAEIKQAETDRIVRMRELEIVEKREKQSNKQSKILTMIWLIMSIFIVILCVVKIAFQDDFTSGFLMLFYIGAPVIAGGGYLIFKLIPEKENDKLALQNGGIRFPKNLEPFTEKNYEIVAQVLSDAGFDNISCINMHDLTFGLITKPGKIESILVNGEKIVSGGKIYMPDVAITISYHGK